MTKLFDLVQGLFELLLSLWDFVVGLVGDLVYIAKLLPKVIISIPSMLNSLLPSSVVAIIMTFVAVTVIYRIMGRD